MTTPLPVPPVIETLARRVADQGGRAWLVGGCVRDHLMGVPLKDLDVEVFGLPADALLTLLRKLGRVDAVGRSFGVFKLRPRGSAPDDPEIDVAIPRRDSKVGPGHRGIAVEGDPDMSTYEAARRRDLTINAILLDPLTGELEDPFHGQQDIEEGVLRPVDDDTFLEDPLRALRAVQFTARLCFTPAPSLVALCRRAELHELPAERVQGEWSKLLLQGRRPSLGLALARQAEILPRVFPEAARVDGPHVDQALDRLVTHRDALEPEGRRLALMLAGWLHPDPEAVEPTLDRLWLHRFKGYPVRDQVLGVVRSWRAPYSSDAALRHLSTRCELALVLRIAWALTDDPTALQALDRAEALGIATAPPPPLLKGRHLKAFGVEPGPAMGHVLKHVYALQLDGAVATLDDARAAARDFLEQGRA